MCITVDKICLFRSYSQSYPHFPQAEHIFIKHNSLDIILENKLKYIKGNGKF